MAGEFDPDVFISYAHIDNRTLSTEQKGWISRLHEDLKTRLAQLLGEEPEIWCDPKLQGNDYFDDKILQTLFRAAVLVAIFTPRYVKSEWCLKEINQFIRAAEKKVGLRIDNKCRILKVIKTPIDDYPVELKDVLTSLLGYEFFEIDPVKQRTREFIPGFGASIDRKFVEILDDLAHDICDLLKRMKGEGPVSVAPSGPCVYLAVTTSDLKSERDQIRRDLQTRGYTVLPDSELPLSAPEFQDAIKRDLARSVLSVHLVGEHYALVPEGAERSVVELQYHMAAERSKRELGFSRLVWLPAQLTPEDSRQQCFIALLQNDPDLQSRDDVLQIPLEDLKTTILDRLRAPEKAQAPAIKAGISRIYLLFDQRDSDSAITLYNHLYDQGFEVLKPLFEGDEAEISEEHRENLKICDGALIYWGHAGEAWLRGKVRDLIKAPGYGRTAHMQATAIYIAAPEIPAKTTYRTHEVDALIKQFGEFAPEELMPFLGKMKKREGR